MAKDNKTNVCRLLDKAKIPYVEQEYPVDEEDLSGAHVASVLGFPPEIIYKTLVSRRLSKWLDKEDFIAEEYILEVCSLGFKDNPGGEELSEVEEELLSGEEATEE